MLRFQRAVSRQERLDLSVPRSTYEASQADRDARLTVIERQGQQIDALKHRQAVLLDELSAFRKRR
jgi:hypothetical protein